MERRYYYAGFLGVALGVQVSGPVGRLKVKIIQWILCIVCESDEKTIAVVS